MKLRALRVKGSLPNVKWGSSMGAQVGKSVIGGIE